MIVIDDMPLEARGIFSSLKMADADRKQGLDTVRTWKRGLVG